MYGFKYHLCPNFSGFSYRIIGLFSFADENNVYDIQIFKQMVKVEWYKYAAGGTSCHENDAKIRYVFGDPFYTEQFLQ